MHWAGKYLSADLMRMIRLVAFGMGFCFVFVGETCNRQGDKKQQ